MANVSLEVRGYRVNERKQLWRVLEAVGVCVIFAACWAIGGSGDFGGHKWIRRFLGPGLFGSWAFIRSGFNWRYLAQMPFMIGASTLPYGADTFGLKVLLRGVFGLANGTAAALADALSKRWAVVVMIVIINIIVSIGAGVWNQFSNAIAEQFLIGFMIVLLPALSLRKKE